jgi:hypothetical protein
VTARLCSDVVESVTSRCECATSLYRDDARLCFPAIRESDSMSQGGRKGVSNVGQRSSDARSTHAGSILMVSRSTSTNTGFKRRTRGFREHQNVSAGKITSDPPGIERLQNVMDCHWPVRGGMAGRPPCRRDIASSNSRLHGPSINSRASHIRRSVAGYLARACAVSRDRVQQFARLRALAENHLTFSVLKAIGEQILSDFIWWLIDSLERLGNGFRTKLPVNASHPRPRVERAWRSGRGGSQLSGERLRMRMVGVYNPSNLFASHT